jgi:hypothetical protein
MAHITPAHVDRLHSTLSGLDEVRSDVLGGILRDANIVSPDDRRQLIDELVRVKALVPLSTNEHQQVTYRVNVSGRGATVVNTQPLQVIEQEAVQQLRAHAGKRLQTFQLAAILVAAGATTPELRGIATHRLIKRGVVQETVDGDRKSYVVVGAAAQPAATVRVAPSVSEIGVLTMRKITVPGSDTVRADVLGGSLHAEPTPPVRLARRPVRDDTEPSRRLQPPLRASTLIQPRPSCSTRSSCSRRHRNRRRTRWTRRRSGR